MQTPWSSWPMRSRKLDPLGYVYVIEFAVGPATIVKVGRTDAPRTRAKQHEYDVSRFGGRIARCWLSEPHLHWHIVESLLIEHAAKLGLKLGGQEYFIDVTYEELVAVAQGWVVESQEIEANEDGPRGEGEVVFTKLTKESNSVIRDILGSYRALKHSGQVSLWEAYCEQHLSHLREIRWSKDQRVEVIRRLRRQGMSLRAIGAPLGLGPSSVTYILDSFGADGIPNPNFS
ncbi:GIY-YIG nuclease family protein [Geodermatophilus sp. URMC 65]